MKLLSRIRKLFNPTKYSMKIFIDNSGFNNRGDQLMIQAVQEQLFEHYPNAQMLVKKDVFLQNPTYCMAHKLYPLELSKSRIKQSLLYKKVLNLLLRDEWIVTPRDVDVILDCRGYHLADWRITNQDYVEFLRNYYEKFSKKNRKLIMLPQAFGPFENPYSKEAMLIVSKQANYIYAREKTSYSYLKDLLPEFNNIEVSPDFTCLTQEYDKRSIILPKKEYIILIPNTKMIEQGKSTEEQYISWLAAIAKHLQKNGENIILLNHEGEKDEILLKKVNIALGCSLPIYTNLSGLEIKALINDAKLVISGRYHGVVSGLTQHAPTLCTGWSHKYAELMAEHKCYNNILSVDDLQGSISLIDAALKCPKEYSSKENCVDFISYRVRAMWSNIFRYF